MSQVLNKSAISDEVYFKQVKHPTNRIWKNVVERYLLIDPQEANPAAKTVKKLLSDNPSNLFWYGPPLTPQTVEDNPYLVICNPNEGSKAIVLLSNQQKACESNIELHDCFTMQYPVEPVTCSQKHCLERKILSAWQRHCHTNKCPVGNHGFKTLEINENIKDRIEAVKIEKQDLIAQMDSLNQKIEHLKSKISDRPMYENMDKTRFYESSFGQKNLKIWNQHTTLKEAVIAVLRVYTSWSLFKHYREIVIGKLHTLGSKKETDVTPQYVKLLLNEVTVTREKSEFDNIRRFIFIAMKEAIKPISNTQQTTKQAASHQ